MRRALGYIFPIIILAAFTWVMNTDALLKRPMSETDDLTSLLDTLQMALISEDWTLASGTLAKANQAWAQVIRRIQYGGERDQISKLTTSLNRIKGAIIAKNRSGALTELGEASQLWSDIGK